MPDAADEIAVEKIFRSQRVLQATSGSSPLFPIFPVGRKAGCARCDKGRTNKNEKRKAKAVPGKGEPPQQASEVRAPRVPTISSRSYVFDRQSHRGTQEGFDSGWRARFRNNSMATCRGAP